MPSIKIHGFCRNGVVASDFFFICFFFPHKGGDRYYKRQRLAFWILDRERRLKGERVHEGVFVDVLLVLLTFKRWRFCSQKKKKRLWNYTLLLINLKMYFVYSSKEPAFVTLTPPEQYFISALEQYFLCANKWQKRIGFFLLTAFRSLLL